MYYAYALCEQLALGLAYGFGFGFGLRFVIKMQAQIADGARAL
jgi:hypothetical protein